MKRALRNLLRASGAFAPFRLVNRNRALILMYHRFSEVEDQAATSARAFRAHLDYLSSRYRLVPLSEIAGYLTRGEALPPRLAAITIDDGYRDTYEIALPLLKEYKAPATLFVVTDFIERKTWLWTDKLKFILPRTTRTSLEVSLKDNLSRIELSDDQSRQLAAAQVNALLKCQANQLKDKTLDELSNSLGVVLPETPPEEFHPLTWNQVIELDRAGVEIGSHTVTHPILTRTDAMQLRAELRQSKALLEMMLKRPVDLFCYPNGDYDQQVVRETAAAGYRSAVTTDFGLNGSQVAPLLLKRIPAASDLAQFAQDTCGFQKVGAGFRKIHQLVARPAAMQSAQSYREVQGR
jgi:peptidoglycan/xylan/chitin deacetylase (PgdA/CDA1 family)